jgi:hypothetical protein
MGLDSLEDYATIRVEANNTWVVPSGALVSIVVGTVIAVKIDV